MDRDAIIETEESTKRKKIQPDFSSYNKFGGGLVSDFLVDPNAFEAFSTDLGKKKEKNIYLETWGPRRFSLI